MSAQNASDSLAFQFSHFGVLEKERQSRSSIATSLTINLGMLGLAVLLSLAAKKMIESPKQVTTLVAPVILKPPPPPIVAPRILPAPPPPPKLIEAPPKITLPEVKVPEAPKPAPVHMAQPAPVVTPPAPRHVEAPPAPVAVSLAHPAPAAVAAPVSHPTAVALGRTDNPIAPSNRPATASVDLGQRGAPGMPASNTGTGPARVSLGSGSPSGANMAGNGTREVAGVRLGTGSGPGSGPGAGTQGRTAGVNLGVTAAPTPTHAAATAATLQSSAPKVIYKPRPEYTAEARAMHLEGVISVRLRVTAAGAVQVLGVSNGLGHGLDQAAENAVRGTRFQPAMDASGHPVDWEGVVNVAFQLAS
ncbi:MAG TPA: energy transducer TonB [Granulicella sp.]